jgi:hypothetical protein
VILKTPKVREPQFREHLLTLEAAYRTCRASPGVADMFVEIDDEQAVAGS